MHLTVYYAQGYKLVYINRQISEKFQLDFQLDFNCVLILHHIYNINFQVFFVEELIRCKSSRVQYQKNKKNNQPTLTIKKCSVLSPLSIVVGRGKHKLSKLPKELLFHRYLQPLSLSLSLFVKDFPLSTFVFFGSIFSLVCQLPSNYSKKGQN